MTNTRAEKRIYWTRHIKAWQASGSSRSAYCRHHDLKLHQLTYWISVLDEKSRAVAPPSNKFIPVRVAPSSAGFTVRLPNGIRIEGVGAESLSVVREMMGWR